MIKYKFNQYLSLLDIKHMSNEMLSKIFIRGYDKIIQEIEHMESTNKRNNVSLKQIYDLVMANGKEIKELNNKVDKGFKRIDERLDYIVKANNLKDLPNK